MENVEDLSVQWEQDGKVVVEELDKRILSKGSWATVLYKYREIKRGTEEFGKPKFTIRRYQKRQGSYRQQSKFNISSEAQAKAIIEALQEWLAE